MNISGSLRQTHQLHADSTADPAPAAPAQALPRHGDSLKTVRQRNGVLLVYQLPCEAEANRAYNRAVDALKSGDLGEIAVRFARLRDKRSVNQKAFLKTDLNNLGAGIVQPPCCWPVTVPAGIAALIGGSAIHTRNYALLNRAYKPAKRTLQQHLGHAATEEIKQLPFTEKFLENLHAVAKKHELPQSFISNVADRHVTRLTTRAETLHADEMRKITGGTLLAQYPDMHEFNEPIAEILKFCETNGLPSTEIKAVAKNRLRDAIAALGPQISPSEPSEPGEYKSSAWRDRLYRYYDSAHALADNGVEKKIAYHAFRGRLLKDRSALLRQSTGASASGRSRADWRVGAIDERLKNLASSDAE